LRVSCVHDILLLESVHLDSRNVIVSVSFHALIPVRCQSKPNRKCVETPNCHLRCT